MRRTGLSSMYICTYVLYLYLDKNDEEETGQKSARVTPHTTLYLYEVQKVSTFVGGLVHKVLCVYLILVRSTHAPYTYA